jgi:hypothetical protein
VFYVRTAEIVQQRAEQNNYSLPKHISPDATYNEKGQIVIVKRSLRGVELPPRPRPQRKTTFDHIGVFTMAETLTPAARLIQKYIDAKLPAPQREHTQDNVRRSQLVIERWNAANRAMWKSIGGRK